MNGYKNAPHIYPRVGDVVECGLPGETAIVSSVGDVADDAKVIGGNMSQHTRTPTIVEVFAALRPRIINCAFDGKLNINLPEEAMLVRTVDGRKPRA